MEAVTIDFCALIYSNDNYLMLWQLAQQGYIEKGRGVVVISDRLKSDNRVWLYICREETLDNSVYEPCHPLIDTYNPLREFVYFYATHRLDYCYGIATLTQSYD